MTSKLRGKSQTKAEVLEVVETVDVTKATDVVEVAETVEATDVVSVIDNAVKNAETATATGVETVTENTAEPKVRINPRQDVRTFIGDQWYNLKAGKQVSVPKTVKEKLQKAGLLSPL